MRIGRSLALPRQQVGHDHVRRHAPAKQLRLLAVLPDPAVEAHLALGCTSPGCTRTRSTSRTLLSVSRLSMRLVGHDAGRRPRRRTGMTCRRSWPPVADALHVRVGRAAAVVRVGHGGPCASRGRTSAVVTAEHVRQEVAAVGLDFPRRPLEFNDSAASRPRVIVPGRAVPSG